jgi:hypothetical protein
MEFPKVRVCVDSRSSIPAAHCGKADFFQTVSHGNYLGSTGTKIALIRAARSRNIERELIPK